MNSRRQASSAPSAIARKGRGWSSASPSTPATRTTVAADRCRYAVETSDLSARVKAGKSVTVTPGSSHSPQWKPVSHRYRSCRAGSGRTAARPGCRPLAAAAAAYRTYAVIAPHISRSSDVSPYAWYRSQDADTTTSPQPDLAAVPAVGQQHREHVPPRRQQRRDVVGLILDPGQVLGVARRQFDIADALPV